MDKKRLVINMTAQLVAFVVNLGVSFILTPIIDAMLPNTIGFVNMANQFVQWAQVIVSALNTQPSSNLISSTIARLKSKETNNEVIPGTLTVCLSCIVIIY